MNRRVLSLIAGIVHALAGISLLIVSAWFIAACAVAGVGFNYMLPAVIVRALALIRIASGYAQMWLGHDDLLSQTNLGREALFARLKAKRISQKAWFVDSLATHTEQIASVWIGWVAHQAAALLILLAGSVVSVVLATNGSGWFWLTALAWLIASTVLIVIGLKKSRELVQNESDFTAASEHYLTASPLWHLRRDSLGKVDDAFCSPQAEALFNQRTSLDYLTQKVLWGLQGVSFLSVAALLSKQGNAVSGEPTSVILPLLILALPELLAQSLTRFPVLSKYIEARRALEHMPVRDCGEIDAPRPAVHVAFHDFSVKDRAGVPALNCILPAKGLIAVQGESGAGKSSLLMAINGELPSSGERRVDNYIVPAGKVADWVMVEQSPVILQATLADNLNPSGRDISEKQMRETLDALQMHYLSDLSQWLGVGGRALSGGEQKRVALARALLHTPHILLVDEPLEGLDAIAASAVMRALADYSRHSLVIVASHIPLSGSDQTLCIGNKSKQLAESEKPDLCQIG